MADLDFPDMQGFIPRGYGNLAAACYLPLRIDDAPAARAWLDALLPQVTPGDHKPDDEALHIAFTGHGLRALGVDEATLTTFSREFWEGMDEPHRARHLLGDRGESHPDSWRWGRADTHVLLLLFAHDGDALERLYQRVRAGLRGVTELQRLDTYSFETTREHFGFNDGIAQPFVRGFTREGPPENTIAPGEVVLGYRNEYGKFPLSPTVAIEHDPHRLLPPSRREEDGREVAEERVRDFGRNGSYLVFRQLSQDVRAFWRFIDEATRLDDGRSSREARTRMAAKMVGRWPSGAPLTLCPDRDDEAQSRRDDFGYRATDEHGHFCPKGAHIRRTNPRDALGGGAKDSIDVSNRHRLLRRGRPYGAPISRSMEVDEILAAEAEHEEVGLHFICLNADIGRQFEFVQHTWINNTKFAGLYSDADPLLGHIEDQLKPPPEAQPERDSTFTLQGEPVRQRVTGIRRFVEMRGGGYFFLPGITALRYLASL